jgi:hypothetical protein
MPIAFQPRPSWVENVARHDSRRQPTIRDAMPAIVLYDHYVVHFAAWKHHIGLYPIPLLPADLEADVGSNR